MSLSSVPPTAGFFSKGFLLIMLLMKKVIIICLFVFIFNLFAMFFYLHNIRYLSGFKSKLNIPNKSNYSYIDHLSNTFICLLAQLNVIIVILFTDCLILSDYLFINLYI